MGRSMGMEDMSMLLETSIKVNLEQVWRMVRVFINMWLVISMRDLMKMILSVVMGWWNSSMEISIQGNGKMIYSMEEVHTFSIKNIKSKAFSVMDNCKPNQNNSILHHRGRKPIIVKASKNQLKISLLFLTRKIKYIDRI